MAVLPDQQDMLIAHQQDGRSAGMADEIALRADTMIQQHLIAVQREDVPSPDHRRGKQLHCSTVS